MGRRIVLAAATLAASLSIVFLVSYDSSVRSSSLESAGGKKGSDFKTVWGDWLARVTREVRAAVGVSNGLSPQKKMALDGLLRNDLVSHTPCFRVVNPDSCLHDCPRRPCFVASHSFDSLTFWIPTTFDAISSSRGKRSESVLMTD